MSFKKIGVALLATTFMTACGSNSFDLGLTGENFQQSSTSTRVPIDILWVIDNSGSMETSQANLAANFASFITNFQNTNFDYQIAVTTTEAYQSAAVFGGDPSWSRFKDGNPSESSGVRIITPNTPNLDDVFQVNVSQGIAGDADERGLQSLEEILSNADNLADSFPRPGAFLAVIIMSDEEDFSHSGVENIQFNGSVPNTVDDSRLTPVSYYTDFLDDLMEGRENYMVNTIGIFDQACETQLATQFTGRRITERYAEISDATGGVKASLCEDFSDILSNISDTILQQTTKFYLDREAVSETLKVLVDGVALPEGAYIYDPSELSISFANDYIPPEGSRIEVVFQPTSVQ